jgi:hypothetical protein
MPGTESPSIGELPPVGEVPKRMRAQLIRQDRFGDPRTAFRLQGSHGTNDGQARAYHDLVVRGIVDPCLGKLYRFEEIPDAHDEMERGVDVFGNRVALVGAREPGLGRK